MKYGSASPDPSYPATGVFTYVAVDRNGISDPPTAMTYDKIATYSSAKAKMLTTDQVLVNIFQYIHRLWLKRINMYQHLLFPISYNLL